MFVQCFREVQLIHWMCIIWHKCTLCWYPHAYFHAYTHRLIDTYMNYTYMQSCIWTALRGACFVSSDQFFFLLLISQMSSFILCNLKTSFLKYTSPLLVVMIILSILMTPGCCLNHRSNSLNLHRGSASRRLGFGVMLWQGMDLFWMWQLWWCSPSFLRKFHLH